MLAKALVETGQSDNVVTSAVLGESEKRGWFELLTDRTLVKRFGLDLIPMYRLKKQRCKQCSVIISQAFSSMSTLLILLFS